MESRISFKAAAIAACVAAALFIALLFTFHHQAPLLIDLRNPYDRNVKNHQAADSFIAGKNNRLDVLTAVQERFELRRKSGGILVKEYKLDGKQKEFVQTGTCGTFTSLDMDYGGRMLLLSGCGPSGEDTISLGSLSY